MRVEESFISVDKPVAEFRVKPKSNLYEINQLKEDEKNFAENSVVTSMLALNIAPSVVRDRVIC